MINNDLFLSFYAEILVTTAVFGSTVHILVNWIFFSVKIKDKTNDKVSLNSQYSDLKF